jgi:hypothetical protein
VFALYSDNCTDNSVSFITFSFKVGVACCGHCALERYFLLIRDNFALFFFEFVRGREFEDSRLFDTSYLVRSVCA